MSSSSAVVMSSSTDMLLTRLGFGAEFPVGLRVMAIDPDFASLNILNAFLLQCNFTVICDVSARNALERIYVGNEKCDIVVTELDNLDVDASVFLEQMCNRAPIVVLSNLDDKIMIMKAILIGVADYMLKPSTLEMMRNIWQHVVKSRLSYSGIQLANNGIYTRRNSSSNPNPESSSNMYPKSPQTLLLEGGTSENQHIDEICQYTHVSENINSEKKDGNDDDGNYIDNEDSNSIKKPRISWDHELHQRFITAVDQLCGPEIAKPKQILELMNVPWLSRENVASHLQKYRLAMKNQLKVRPIWMDSNKEGSVANSQITGFPFLHASSSSAEATREQHYLSYPHPYDHLAPIIEPPQYKHDDMFENISNHLFTHHNSQDFHVQHSQDFHGQQPPIAPSGGNFNNNIRVINGPAAPM